MKASNASALLSTVKESSALFWNSRNVRERAILAAAGLALMLCLIYAIFFSPAIHGRTQLSKDLPVLRQQLAELQVLAKQAADLNSAGAPAVPPISQDSVAASLAARGMKPQSLAVTEGTIRVQLNPVSFAGLLDWLDEQQKTVHVTVVDANFVALLQTDMVNASLTLRQQRSEEKFE